MIEVGFVRMMARYNAWQNRSMVAAADGLTDDARRLDRGAFFRSIHATFSHILWADGVWLHRLIGTAKPVADGRGSSTHAEDWERLRERRFLTDQTILDWASTIEPAWLDGDLVWYSGAAGREMTKPRAFLIAHVFNHQTHHRGQIHAMLTAAGAKPDDTDFFLVEEKG